MRAMRLHAPGRPLVLEEIETPVPDAGQALIRVETCAVCRTDLHVVDGELGGSPVYPITPGHQVIGTVAQSRAESLETGQRVGVPWLGWTCGECRYCRSARENLCPHAAFTGYTLAGGFADYLVADARYCFEVDSKVDAVAEAPLLCAGLIGYRALRMCGAAARIGIYGFGAAAHILAQILQHEKREFFAFTRPGDSAAQNAARELGATWAGGSDEQASFDLDAAIIFAPVGALVPAALQSTCPGATVVCAGIHMSDIPAFPYALLWGERALRSVANLTRADGLEFLEIAGRIRLQTHTVVYALEDANRALDDLRAGKFTGSAVLAMS